MKKLLLVLLLPAAAHCGIYTQPNPADTGGLTGTCDAPLTHAIALEHDHVRAYRARLENGSKAFVFEHLPVGKYDLILVTSGGVIFDGLRLGEEPKGLAEASMAHLQERLAKADAFFNRLQVHRIGLAEDHAYVLAERLRDEKAVAHSGKALDKNIRRIEVIDLQRAQDDWQMIGSRHLYREAEPLGARLFKNAFLPALQNIRVAGTNKDLGTFTLQTP